MNLRNRMKNKCWLILKQVEVNKVNDKEKEDKRKYMEEKLKHLNQKRKRKNK